MKDAIHHAATRASDDSRSPPAARARHQSRLGTVVGRVRHNAHEAEQAVRASPQTTARALSCAHVRCSRANGTSTIVRMRPGPGVITATRSPRKIASSTLWVMNSTVRRVSRRCAAVPPAASCASARRPRQTARPSASLPACWRACARRRRAASCRRRAHADTCARRDAGWRARDSGARSRSAPAAPMPRSLSPSAALSSTFIHGKSAYSWNTTPRSALGPTIGLAVHHDAPAVGRRKPAIAESSVDLPQPDGPEHAEELVGRHVEVEPFDGPMADARSPG